jgi:two-component system chemotaxis response regulator CheB
VTAPSIICIGTSTGGPNALADVFTELRQPLSVPVVVVQHMPPVFTRLLAERLSQSSRLSCVEGEDGQSLQPGKIYLAPGGKHMEVERNGPWGRLRLHEEPPVNSCRPSVDVLFASVAKAYGAAALGVVLTGMGQDGLRGCERLRENGGRVIVQDEATSIVWGMPARVAEAGLAEKILPLKEIADELRRRADAVARATEKRSA